MSSASSRLCVRCCAIRKSLPSYRFTSSSNAATSPFLLAWTKARSSLAVSVTASCAEFRHICLLTFRQLRHGSLLIEPVFEVLIPTKWTPARARICNRHCERFENEQGEPGLFQISDVVLRRGCRRCGSKDSFRIPTPPSAIRPAKTHGPDLT